jgi:hypothetical protein
MSIYHVHTEDARVIRVVADNFRTQERCGSLTFENNDGEIVGYFQGGAWEGVVKEPDDE